MNGIGKDFPFQALQNVTLDFVGFGSNVLILTFSNDATLNIMGGFVIKDAASQEDIAQAEEIPNGSSILFAKELVSLIFHNLESAITKNYKDLILNFDTKTLIIFDDAPNYESYILSYNGKDYVV